MAIVVRQSQSSITEAEIIDFVAKQVHSLMPSMIYLQDIFIDISKVMCRIYLLIFSEES